MGGTLLLDGLPASQSNRNTECALKLEDKLLKAFSGWIPLMMSLHFCLVSCKRWIIDVDYPPFGLILTAHQFL